MLKSDEQTNPTKETETGAKMKDVCTTSPNGTRTPTFAGVDSREGHELHSYLNRKEKRKNTSTP
jgi:hypothetical protein